MSKQERRYNQWAGNPKGDREDPQRCIAEVADFTGFHWHQCRNKRGKGKNGLYCGIHAKTKDRRGAWA